MHSGCSEHEYYLACFLFLSKEVISVSKKYLNEVSYGFNHPKVKVFLQDGIEFVRMAESKYDVIITDCSDLGPAEVLFQQTYFQYIHRALKPGGITCIQGKQSRSGLHWNNVVYCYISISSARTMLVVSR